MINKLKTVEEEADEILCRLELISEADLIPESRLTNLMTETDSILAMTVASLKTYRSKSIRKW